MKKMKYLAVIPTYGSVLLLFWLFIKMLKREINTKKFYIYFYLITLMGGSAYIILKLLLLLMINPAVEKTVFRDYIMIAVDVLCGYLINLFS